MTELVFALVFAAVALSMQLFATVRVQRSPSYETDQKRAQFKLIWLLPVVGAAMVLAIMHQDGELTSKSPRDRSSQQRMSLGRRWALGPDLRPLLRSAPDPAPNS